MKIILLGNLLGLISSVLVVYIGTISFKEKLLKTTIIQYFIALLSNLVLQGYSGVVINIIAIIRNYICYKNKLNTKVKIIIGTITIIITLIFNNLGIGGLLPLVATISYLIFMDTNNMLNFKILTIVNNILWIMYFLIIKNYISIMFNLFSIATNLLVIFKIKNNKLYEG